MKFEVLKLKKKNYLLKQEKELKIMLLMNDMKLQFFGSEKFSIIMTIDFNQNFQKDEIRQQIFSKQMLVSHE